MSRFGLYWFEISTKHAGMWLRGFQYQTVIIYISIKFALVRPNIVDAFMMSLIHNTCGAARWSSYPPDARDISTPMAARGVHHWVVSGELLWGPSIVCVCVCLWVVWMQCQICITESYTQKNTHRAFKNISTKMSEFASSWAIVYIAEHEAPSDASQYVRQPARMRVPDVCVPLACAIAPRRQRARSQSVWFYVLYTTCLGNLIES